MKKQNASLLGFSDREIEIQALTLLNNDKYKDAIKLFKHLLKNTQNEQWKNHVAYCYVQRALEFANKKMYKEAIVLWENHQAYAHAPYTAYDQYITWLIFTDNTEKTEQALSQLSVQQLDKQYPSLASIVGILILTQHPEFQPLLPQDSTFIRHLTIVQSALHAYQNDDTEGLNDHLKQLPYRSAYKDLRHLLNAAYGISHSTEQAQTLLAKIPTDSIYAPVAKLLLISTQSGAKLGKQLPHLSHQQRQLIADIKDFSQEQRDFIAHFCRQNEQSSPKTHFKIALQFKSLLGDKFTQQFCQSLLNTYPAGNKDFNKHFGQSNIFEENRINALNCEQDNNYYDAEYYWNHCIEYLIAEDRDNNLKIALIFRHIAKTQPLIEEHAELLINSLQFDDSDRDSYLQIIQLYNQQPQTAKDYKQWLTKTLTRFPQDVDVLVQVTKAATADKSHKKASHYAAEILILDPINTFAKQTLFFSHLSRSQQFMRDKKYSLAEKEIIPLEKFSFNKQSTKRVQLMQAILHFSLHDKQQGAKNIASVLNTLHNDPINIHFHAAMEALLNKLAVATVLRELPSVKEYILNEKNIAELTQQLNDQLERDESVEYVKKSLDKIKAPLKASISAQHYTESTLLTLSETLSKVEHYELLRHCVKTITWDKKTPIWNYYSVYASTNGDAKRCTTKDIQVLLYASSRSKDNNDPATTLLIDRFLETYYESESHIESSFIENLLGGDKKKPEDILDVLFEHIDHGTSLKLEHRASEIVKKTTPEALIQSFSSHINDIEPLLLLIMKNPDLLSALLLFKAATELKIDIGLSFNDITHAFRGL